MKKGCKDHMKYKKCKGKQKGRIYQIKEKGTYASGALRGNMGR